MRHNDWRSMTLREAGVSLIDCVHKTPPAVDTGYPYVAIPQLAGGRIDFSTARRITAKHHDEWTRKAKPRPNDVVLSRRCNPGETAVDRTGQEFALGQNLVLLRADGHTVHPPFLRWLVRGPDWWNAIQKNLNVGAVFDSLKCADVPNFELPIPPVRVQEAIADTLDALDDKIEHNRRTSRTLEGLARAMFKAWFVDFEPVHAKAAGATSFPGMPPEAFAALPTRFTDSQLGPVPEGWRHGRLGELMDIHDSRRIPLSKKEREAKRGQVRYFGAAGIIDYVDEFLFDGVHVLTGEDGSVANDDGTPVTQYVWGRFWVNNHAHVLTARTPWTNEHLLLLLQSLQVKPFVTGAVQPKLSQGNLKSIPVIIPDDAVLGAFGSFIDPLFAAVRSAHDEAERLAELRDYLLPKLLSGEVRVKSESPAEVGVA